MQVSYLERYAYEEGVKAAADDLPARANPYRKHGLYHKAWCKGWASDYRPKRTPELRSNKQSDINYQGDIFHE